jgi:hypothetical protein
MFSMFVTLIMTLTRAARVRIAYGTRVGICVGIGASSAVLYITDIEVTTSLQEVRTRAKKKEERLIYILINNIYLLAIISNKY